METFTVDETRSLDGRSGAIVSDAPYNARRKAVKRELSHDMLTMSQMKTLYILFYVRCVGGGIHNDNRQ